MSYRLQMSLEEHQTTVVSFLQSYRDQDTDLTLLPEDGGLPVTTSSLSLAFHSPFLRNVFSSLLPSSPLSLSVPAHSSSLTNLLELLATGKVVSQSRQEVEQVQEVAKVLGFTLGECQVGSRGQGVKQEKTEEQGGFKYKSEKKKIIFQNQY